MALYKTVITNMVQYCMHWCLNEIFFLLIASQLMPQYSFGEKKFAFPQMSSLAMKIHAPMQPKIASIFLPLLLRDTLQEILPLAEMLFGSLDPSPLHYAYT